MLAILWITLSFVDLWLAAHHVLPSETIRLSTRVTRTLGAIVTGAKDSFNWHFLRGFTYCYLLIGMLHAMGSAKQGTTEGIWQSIKYTLLYAPFELSVQLQLAWLAKFCLWAIWGATFEEVTSAPPLLGQPV